MLALALLYFPILGAVITAVSGNTWAKKMALGISLVELVLTYFVFQSIDLSSGTIVADYWWIADLGISFKLSLDGTSFTLVLLTNLLLPLIIWSGFKKEQSQSNWLYSLMLVMQTALLGVFMAHDAFLFYIFWELALIPIYLICLNWGGENRGKITLKFFIYTLVGSLFMLVAFLFVYFQTPGLHSFDWNSFTQASISNNDQRWVFWFLFLAFAIKMPIFPFHTWQPDTYTNSPTQGTMLLSGIMLKMGVFGLIKWLLPIVPFGVICYGPLAMWLCVIGVLYASLIALVQSDFKRLIAYSSIAHVGLIGAGVFSQNTMGVQGAVFQMFSHGIIVVGLFFVADLIESRMKTRELSALGGIRSMAPKFGTFFTILMLGSVALPLTNGFVGEFLLLNGIFQYNGWMALVAGSTVILGAVYMLSGFQKIMLGNTNSLTETFEEIKGHEWCIMAILAVIVIVLGVYPQPILNIIEPSIQGVVKSVI